MPARNIKVAIADDHDLFRKGKVALLKDFKGIKVVLEAGNGKELLAALEHTPCDIVLMDVRMPEMDGYDATELLTEKYPDIRVIALSQYDDGGVVKLMIKLGVRSFLLKTADPADVEKAIRSVMENGWYINELMSKGIRYLSKSNKRGKTPAEESITAIEMEVLKLICQKYKTKEIAEKLFRSIRTIESIRSSLLVKTASKNVVGLVLYAIDIGLLKPNGKLSLHHPLYKVSSLA